MKTRAAVAYEAGKPLQIEEIELAGPRDRRRPGQRAQWTKRRG